MVFPEIRNQHIDVTAVSAVSDSVGIGDLVNEPLGCKVLVALE